MNISREFAIGLVPLQSVLFESGISIFEIVIILLATVFLKVSEKFLKGTRSLFIEGNRKLHAIYKFLGNEMCMTVANIL